MATKTSDYCIYACCRDNSFAVWRQLTYQTEKISGLGWRSDWFWQRFV